MGLSNRQKAVLHVAKTQLALDEETYRDILEAHAGVRSSVSLTYGGFLRVMRHFEACGFERRQIPPGPPLQKGGGRAGMASDAELGKIRAMWAGLAGTYYRPGAEWKALRGFLKKRFRVDHENFLTAAQARKVIEAIKAISSREQGAGSGEK